MKKLYFFFVIALMAQVGFAADNTIKMVTYFPVPYASYNYLDVYGRCDVGMIGQCNMSMGGPVVVSQWSTAILGERNNLLNTGAVKVSAGKLSLNLANSGTASDSTAQVVATQIWSGAKGDNSAKPGKFTFTHDVTIKNLKAQKMGVLAGKAYLKKLQLKSKDFPHCGGSGETGEISWQVKNIDNQQGVFLVCDM